jgi:hypothetical protein
MRGDQLAWQWRVLRTIGASSNELTVAENVRPDGGLYLMKEKPFKSLFQKLGWAFLFLGDRRQYFFRNFFYYPNLIGMGNKAQALNYVPLFSETDRRFTAEVVTPKYRATSAPSPPLSADPRAVSQVPSPTVKSLFMLLKIGCRPVQINRRKGLGIEPRQTRR